MEGSTASHETRQTQKRNNRPFHNPDYLSMYKGWFLKLYHVSWAFSPAAGKQANPLEN